MSNVQVFIPGNDDGDSLLSGGGQCEKQAEIVIPLLGDIGGHSICLEYAAMIVRELQIDLRRSPYLPRQH